MKIDKVYISINAKPQKPYEWYYQFLIERDMKLSGKGALDKREDKDVVPTYTKRVPGYNNLSCSIHLLDNKQINT